VVKDQSDILALIDPEKGGGELDLQFLGTEMEEFPFLRQTVLRVALSREGAVKYAIEPAKASEIVKRFEGLVFR
jgi:hypothetical protein